LVTQVSPKTAKADPCEPIRKQCNNILDKCDKALDAKNKQLELSDLTIKKCAEKGTKLEIENGVQKEELGRWYRNPWIVGALGLLGGALGGFLIKDRLGK
jgi:hypothetical protein